MAAMQAAHSEELLRLGETHEIELRAIRFGFEQELQRRRDAWTAQNKLIDIARQHQDNERKHRLAKEKELEDVQVELQLLRKQISELCGCVTRDNKRRRLERSPRENGHGRN